MVLSKGPAALAVALALVSAGPAAAAEPIRIGSTVSATGPASFLGFPEQRTLEIYVEKINREGGILGRPIQLVLYDDAGDVERGRSLNKRLIENDKVDIIVGSSTTGVALAVAPMMEKAEIPYISLAGAEAITTPVRKWIFKTPHTDRMAAQKILGDMKAHGYTRIALITGMSSFGQGGRKVSLEEAPKAGIEVLADETYSPNDVDMTPQLSKIKGLGTVQAVLNYDTGQENAVVTRNFRQIDMPMQLYQTHAVASKKFIDLAGAAAEGVRLPAAALLAGAQLPETDPQRPVVLSYIKYFEDTTKNEVSTFGGHAYDGLMIALEAIKRAGSTDKARVRDEIERTRGFIGTGGVVTMSPADHVGLDLSAFRMFEVRNGTWKLVD